MIYLWFDEQILTGYEFEEVFKSFRVHAAAQDPVLGYRGVDPYLDFRVAGGVASVVAHAGEFRRRHAVGGHGAAGRGVAAFRRAALCGRGAVVEVEDPFLGCGGRQSLRAHTVRCDAAYLRRAPLARCYGGGRRRQHQYGHAVYGGIDGDGAGGHLGDGDNIGELVHGQPMIGFHNLFLDQRNGGISAAKAKQTDLDKGP